MKKRNFLVNTLKKKCPRCQEGDLFIKPFEFSKPLHMPAHCPVCQQKFEPEPGFYYGAMFISYILSGFLFLAIAGVCLFIFKFSLNQSMLVVLIVAIFSYFFFLRISRSLWINLLIKYDPQAKLSKVDKSFGY